jgi:hypothetical protein
MTRDSHIQEISLITLLEEQYTASSDKSQVRNFEREDDSGNTEYKLHLGNQEKLVERTT